MKEVYILYSDYTPDAGSTIYGVFSTYKRAQERMEELEGSDNEYGEPQPDMDIDTHRVED